jgi:hypothetical protein
MKILRTLIIVLAGVVLLTLAISHLLPTEVVLKRSIRIHAPIDSVYTQVRFFKNFPKWSPWQKLDPAMKTSISGQDGTVGAVYSWSGNEQAGTGTQTITKLEPTRLVTLAMHFTAPFESKATSQHSLTQEGDDVMATWGFTTEMARPMNLLIPILGLEKSIRADYEQGLANLKTLCEKP